MGNLDFELDPLDEDVFRATGLGVHYDRIGEGLDVLSATIQENELLGITMDGQPSRGEIDAVRVSLPKPPDDTVPTERLVIYPSIDELHIMYQGLRLAAVHARKTQAVLARTYTDASIRLREKNATYTSLAEYILGRLRSGATASSE